MLFIDISWLFHSICMLKKRTWLCPGFSLGFVLKSSYKTSHHNCRTRHLLRVVA
nr:MAG TPA: hypothetical protein [Caudoviricetes sp.]